MHIQCIYINMHIYIYKATHIIMTAQPEVTFAPCEMTGKTSKAVPAYFFVPFSAFLAPQHCVSYFYF